ncbi:hypothetical protein [Aquihabitans sp. McL0605]|uniref:hypothetical protein n=1 Tax=Aquihabitans sp. McL0605 TaxID=3415671 RepID=UPI003CF30E7F
MRKSTASERWDADDGDDRVRVVLECPAEASPALIAQLIERHGYAVRTCEGPGARPCSLLAYGACELVDGADVVVNMLTPGPVQHDVLHAVAGTRRPPAVIAEIPRATDLVAGGPGGAPVPENVTVVTKPTTTRKLMDAMDQALDRGGKDRALPS